MTTDIIIHKHSITAGDAPEPAELNLGELAIQAADGHIYLKKIDGTVNRVTMLPGGGTQQVLYKTGAGNYALGWGTITSTLMGGTLWSEVVAEVQRVFELVEGTASVLLTAPATLTAGSTGPITVSVADTDYLTDGTSITGVLGTVYGTLSRSGSTYSFESVQSYTNNVTFATGTRFAAAFLNDTFNPLRIGSAEVEDDNSYTYGSGYSHAVVDSAGRIGYGVKNDGTFDVPSGNINLDDAKIQENNSYADGSGYHQVVLDSSDRIAYGVQLDGSVSFAKQIAGEAERAARLTPLGDNDIAEDDAYSELYAQVDLDSNGRISGGTRATGVRYFPKAQIDELNVSSLTLDGQPLGGAQGTLAAATNSLYEGRSGQIFLHTGGVETQLTSSGSNYNISLTAETPYRVLFYSNRDGGDAKPYVMDADGDYQSPAVSDVDIAWWGDSMSSGQEEGIGTALAGLGDTTSRTVKNFGYGGQSSIVVAMRQGATDWTGEVSPGNTTGTIPALNSDYVSIGNFRNSILTSNIQKHAALISSQGWTVDEDPLSYGTWQTSDPPNAQYNSYKLVDVSINGVEGNIWRIGYNHANGYVFKRKTSGTAVAVTNPVNIEVLGNGYDNTVGNALTNQEHVQLTSILWPFGPHTPGGFAADNYAFSVDIERDVLNAMLKQLRPISKRVILLYEQRANPASRSTNYLKDIIYEDEFSDIYYDYTSHFANGVGSIPSFKDWFSANYPSDYADSVVGWQAPFETYNGTSITVIPTTNAVSTITVTGDGASGITDGTYLSVDTTTPEPNNNPSFRARCRLGIVASGGVVQSAWVREGGLAYAVNDVLTIPAGAIGNTADITATVSSVNNEVVGIVRNQNGSIDSSLSYSQFDVANGYIPRSALRDGVHFNNYGAEYLNLLLAHRVQSLNW